MINMKIISVTAGLIVFAFYALLSPPAECSENVKTLEESEI